MSYYDCEETGRAVRAYHRRGNRKGQTLQQPNRYDSGLEGNTVVLRSGDNVLARYRALPDGGVRRLVSTKV